MKITVTQAVRRFQKSRYQIYKCIHTGNLRAEKIGRRWLISVDASADHVLTVEWDVDSMVRGRHPALNRTVMSLSGRSVSGTVHECVYLRHKRNPYRYDFVFLSAAVECDFDEWGNPQTIRLNGRDLGPHPRDLGTLSLNGEDMGKVGYTFAPASEWGYVDASGVVIQCRATVPYSYAEKIAAEIGHPIK